MDHPNSQESLKAPHVVVIGGIDSSGGAGISADLRALISLNVREKVFVTCNTYQGPNGPREIEVVDEDLFEKELEFHLNTFSVKPILKIGLIPSLNMAKALVELIQKFNFRVVLDPVHSSSLGKKTLSSVDKSFLIDHLFPLCELITPNIEEASLFWERPKNFWDGSSQELSDFFKHQNLNAVYLKGGHSEGQDNGFVKDFFYSSLKSFFLYQNRLDSQKVQKTRGTGCFLASGIAGAMSLGLPIEDAVVLGKTHLSNALNNAEEGDYQNYLKPCEIFPEDFPWLVRGEEPPQIERFPEMELPSFETEFYPIADRASWIEKFGQWGVKMAQLRVKDLTGEELEEEIKRAVENSKKYNLKLFINDYWELALKYQAYGVHLGQEDLEENIPLKELRDSKICLGVSTHSYEEASFAKSLGPSYVALGPIYFTKLKAMKFSPQGIENFKRWKKLFREPLVAIGGITLERWKEVKEGNPEIVSVVRDITENSSPQERVSSWLQQISEPNRTH